MSLFFAGSSEQQIVAHALSPAVIDITPAQPDDESLPETYKTDRIRLLAQSPRKLFLYWDFARDPFETLRRAFGNLSEDYRLTVRIVATDDESESFYEASPTRSQWFDVLPGQSYRADIGLYARGRSFIRLLSSDDAQTPRAGVARRVDVAPEWSVPAEEFARVLDQSGYVSDALEVALEAADEATHDGATQAIAEELVGIQMPQMNEVELAEMRSLFAALAFGIPFADLRPLLSVPVAAWFSKAGVDGGERLETARLLEILRSTVGVEMTGVPFKAFSEAAMRRAPRVPVGASEVNLPSQPFHLWLPSMTGGKKG